MIRSIMNQPGIKAALIREGFYTNFFDASQVASDTSKTLKNIPAIVRIHPVGDLGAKTHVWILPREMSADIVYAAVFPRLLEGEYVVLDRSGDPSLSFQVIGGEVTTASWSFATEA